MVELLYVSKDFVKPENIKKIEESKNFAKYELSPFEKGFGLTIGNALRRSMLSSIVGAAVYCIKLDGIKHEYEPIEGVKEDLINIIQNLKKLSIDIKSGDSAVLKINQSGNKVVTAGDIECPENINICNPDLVIANLVGGSISGELFVNIGKGYTIAEEHPRKEDQIGTIYIDSIYSPILKVKYDVVKTRVGQSTDYDKIIIEVTTNGSVSVEDSIGYASNLLVDFFKTFINFNPEETKPPEEKMSDSEKKLKALLAVSIEELELTVRSANCLRDAGIKTIGE